MRPQCYMMEFAAKDIDDDDDDDDFLVDIPFIEAFRHVWILELEGKSTTTPFVEWSRPWIPAGFRHRNGMRGLNGFE